MSDGSPAVCFLSEHVMFYNLIKKKKERKEVRLKSFFFSFDHVFLEHLQSDCDHVTVGMAPGKLHTFCFPHLNTVRFSCCYSGLST